MWPDGVNWLRPDCENWQRPPCENWLRPDGVNWQRLVEEWAFRQLQHWQGRRQGVRGGSTEPPSWVNPTASLYFPLHLSVAGMINQDQEGVNVGGVYANIMATFT